MRIHGFGKGHYLEKSKCAVEPLTFKTVPVGLSMRHYLYKKKIKKVFFYIKNIVILLSIIVILVNKQNI